MIDKDLLSIVSVTYNHELFITNVFFVVYG